MQSKVLAIFFAAIAALAISYTNSYELTIFCSLAAVICAMPDNK